MISDLHHVGRLVDNQSMRSSGVMSASKMSMRLGGRVGGKIQTHLRQNDNISHRSNRLGLNP